jgi:hypothetical protein
VISLTLKIASEAPSADTAAIEPARLSYIRPERRVIRLYDTQAAFGARQSKAPSALTKGRRFSNAGLTTFVVSEAREITEWRVPTKKPSRLKVRAVPAELQVCGVRVPSELSHLVETVDQSRWILALLHDWDEEGSPGYSQATWERASRFLLEHAARLLEEHGVQVPAPAIHPGPYGSLDLHWKEPKRELLVNIPADLAVSPDYYGHDRQGSEIKGTLNTYASKQRLLMWLTT